MLKEINLFLVDVSHENYGDAQEKYNKRPPTQKRAWEKIKQNIELITQL